MLDQPLGLFTNFANEIADVARQIVRTAAAGQRRPVAKSDSSPVTETDRAVEQMLRERIADRFPIMEYWEKSSALRAWTRNLFGLSIQSMAPRRLSVAWLFTGR